MTSKVHNDTYPAIDPTKADLSGKVVALVGVSRGIGRSIAISFAKAGASYIAIGARSDLSSVVEAMQHAAKAAGRPVPKIMPLKLDVTAQQSTEDAAATIEKEFGKCDILVNNAGILGETNLITDSDPEEWWRVMDVNLRGPYLVIRAMLPLLLKGGDKTIVNVSSAAAHLTFPTASTYQISKLALLRLSEFVMSEFGSQGVLSYCVHPGNVPTDIFGPGGVANLPDNIKCGAYPTFKSPVSRHARIS